MAKHTLKILRCETARVLKCVWSFYNIMREKVDNQKYAGVSLLRKPKKQYYLKLDIKIIVDNKKILENG